MKVQVIVPAGGTGERMNALLPKPLLVLGGAPVVIHTLKVFEAHPQVAGVILVVHKDHIGRYQEVVKAAGLKKVVRIVPGGVTRTQSVRIGMSCLDSDTDMVMVHDAVRPLVTVRMIDDGLSLALKERAVVAAVPVKPTLKVVDPKTGIVAETLDRSLVWEIQTPQIFERKLFEKAYANDTEATDDAGMVEKLGVAVRVFMGSYRNIKITTPEDLDVAGLFLKTGEVS